MSDVLWIFGIPLDVDEAFVRASGPGGQNVNKVSTAVQLRVDVRRSPLPDHVKARLASLAASKLTTDGILMIDSREHRTQVQNREAARARLVNLIEQAAIRPKKRTATKPKASARLKRLTTKKRRADVKRGRGKASVDD